MKNDSQLDQSLIKAYEATEYHVRSAKPFILELGKKSEGIVDLARRLRVVWCGADAIPKLVLLK